MIKIKDLKQLNTVIDAPSDVMEFVLSANAQTECKKYYFSEGFYANVIDADTRPYTKEKLYETHDKFMDVQILLSGEERMYYGSVDGLSPIKEYNPEKDITFFAKEDGAYVDYKAGEGVALFPEDAHAPNCAVDKPMAIKKLVLKVPVKTQK